MRYMTVKDILDYVDEIKQNSFSRKTKLIWLNELEYRVQTDVMLLAAESITYIPDDDTYTLLVPAPWSEIYYDYILMKLSEHFEESSEQNNRAATFDKAFTRFMRWWADTYRPANGNALFKGYYLKGEDGAFRINVTYSDGVYSSDKTFDEIKAAYNAGQQPYVVQTGNDAAVVYAFAMLTSQFVSFERYLIFDDTAKTVRLRIFPYTLENGSNIEKQISPYNGQGVGIGVTEYHASNNLYDAANLVGTHTINGSPVSGLSNWIPVKAKTKYASDAHRTQYYFFDAEKNYLSGATYMTSPVVVTAPQDGFLLIKTNGNTETIVVEGTDLGNYYAGYYALKESLTKRVSKADNNTWAGKKWLAIGDSLTDPAVASKGYPYLVSKALGLTLTNVGSSGKIMNYFVDLIPDYADDFDLVTVLLGTNNQGYNCGIGSLNDGVDYTTNNSFYAQTQKMAEVLMAKYPTAVIAFITPIRRTGVGEQNNNADGYMINALSLTTEPYAEAVKEVADYYGLPCLDLYHNGINPKSEWMRQRYFVNSDGTHPNNDGHAKYTAPVIKAFLESLAPFGEKAVTYSVTNNLTNAENSNAATSIAEGSTYSASITATSGHVLSSVTVSMGGEDVTGTVYADGAITIDAVTGDIVITATATAASVTTYTITNMLTNAANSNSAASVEEGSSYSATITANKGYELGEVTVTMGGTDISTSAVSGGTITIASVTGNIVINATATEVDSGEPVLVHSYIGTSVPESVLKDQTGSFDLTHKYGDSKFSGNYADANGSAFALSTGDSASFKFVNAYRNTIYFTHGCSMDTSGVQVWNIVVGGNNDTTGRVAFYPFGQPSGNTSHYGASVPIIKYRQDDDGDGTVSESAIYSNNTIEKGETHTMTVTVNATDKVIRLYVDGTLTIDEVMTTEPQFDGLTVYLNADCPFDRLEVYRGIITDVA